MLLFYITCVLTLAQAICQAETTTSVRWFPEKLANGSPCLFTVRAPGARVVSGMWQNHKLEFTREPESDIWDILAGIDIETKPGTYPLAISITFTDGTSQRLDQTVSVEEAPYKSTTLSVPDKFVAPDPVALKRIAADRIVKEKAFAHTASFSLWSGSFKPPLRSAPSTDSFGTRRVFNGSLASVHRGLDYRAKKGTPVVAVNSGRIILARPLYYEGNCVVVDHGQGLMTLYMHLSRFKIAEGARVKRGQIIGLSGATGRATGPHLHLGVRWQGAYLDASKLFAIDLPTLPSPKH